MAGNLPFELNKFSKNRRYLKKILHNTKTSLADIYRSGYFTSDELSLRIEDEEQISDTIENPVGIIVLGSKSWAKAAIVNELLGYSLLPVVERNNTTNSHPDQSNNWRTIRMMYGTQTQVSLAVANHYELVEQLAIYDRVWHSIPASDLEVREDEEPGYVSATLEIKLPHHLLADDVQIVVAPSTSSHLTFENVHHACFEGVTPIVLYALTDSDSLEAMEVDDLMELRRLEPKTAIFFIRASKQQQSQSDLEPSRGDGSKSPTQNVSAASELTESQQHLFFNSSKNHRDILHSPPSSCASPTPLSQSPPGSTNINSMAPPIMPPTQAVNQAELPQPTFGPQSSYTLFQQLSSLGFLTPASTKQLSPGQLGTSTTITTNNDNLTSISPPSRRNKSKKLKDGTVSSQLVENFEQFQSILPFVRQVLQSHLVRAANTLHTLQMRCLRVFILTAFDMTRDMLITPKRIDYARQKEQQLFDSLMAIANKKQEEIKNLISETLNSMRPDLLEECGRYTFRTNGDRLNYGHCTVEPGHCSDPDHACYTSSSNSSTASDHGEPLPPRPRRPSSAGGSMQQSQPSKISARDYQLALSEIQDFVLNHLNTAIAGKLIGSVDYLRDSYVGTLERCLSSLEKYGALSSGESQHESLQATNALKQTLNAAYQVEINIKATSSLLRALWEKIKTVVTSSMLWRTQPSINREWKMKVAADILDSLSESKLAKSICAQFKERLRMSHEQFGSALKHLEALHSGRLEKTEEHRLRVRKVYAPKIARYALESTSLRDLILYGIPTLGREIGRGQYGVVYACDSWAGHSPVAIKSVVPPDDKHWNDLAMEFYYTRSIPDHERIVQIRGSVIDHSYGGGSSPAVLLIMDRLTRDLYSAIRSNLDWVSRLQVAIDVVQGIRFLHSQGLVHRDIKLKNVLLDKRNRAKITDLGFCKPEAMMSGSIVGTPIHMAPELFSGKYDNSVDVYAFGILFWYICAGHVRLPYVFEQCQNKDQLWSCVKRGARPEKLPQFDEECWTIMEQCWSGEPAVRPLLGDVEPRLIAIHERYKNAKPPTGYARNYMRARTHHGSGNAGGLYSGTPPAATERRRPMRREQTHH